MTLDSVRGLAETGVDRISIGALTKDVKAVDFSMRLKEIDPPTSHPLSPHQMSAVIPILDVEYEHPLPGNTCDTKHAWARVPVEPAPAERAALKARIAACSRSATR